jgi:uncharacterized protein YecE (DUF72 family)
MAGGRIHVGVGGWTYEPWRGTFYPKGLPHARELEFASRALTAIEINGTYYRLQSRASFEKWARETPDGFVFTLKASRYCTNRTKLADAGDSIAKFLGQGLTILGDKLGPILWQFMPTKKFDPEDFGAFLKLLPDKQEGVRLRHAVEVRHESFRDPAFVELARKVGAAIVFADSPDYPAFADLTSDFVYARLQDTREEEPTGYDASAIERWTAICRQWAEGEQPRDLPYISDKAAPEEPRDAYIFMISGAKVRAPAAAQALIKALG